MYIQKLRDETESTFATMPSAHSGDGVAFDPTIIMVIVQAVISFVNACKPQPSPANQTMAAGPNEVHPVGRVTLGLKMRLRQETKQQYGKKNWRDVWERHGNDMTETARQVASKATNEDLAGLRREMSDTGMMFSDDE